MKSIYINGGRFRLVLGAVIVHILLTLSVVGHAVVLAAGAVDAYVTARLGLPRLAYVGRRVAELLRHPWEAS